MSIEQSSNKTVDIDCVSNNGLGRSIFTKRSVALNGTRQRMLSEQISALNFRLRSSDETYSSDWHVAGDPTLLIILSGCIRLELRDGQTRDFSAGEMFIAEDYLDKEIHFDTQEHGHRAEVIGEQQLNVLHLKLSKRD